MPRHTLTVSTDVFDHILSFAPVGSLSAAAPMQRAWARAVRRALQRAKGHAEQWLREGLTAMAASDAPHESAALFRRAMATYPWLLDAFFWGAKALMILNDRPGARQVLEGALRQRLSRAQSLRLQAYLCLCVSSDDWGASQLLEEALLLEPDNATVHFEVGFCYHGLHQYDKAIAHYTAALELGYLRTFVLLANRADCRFQTHDLRDGLRDVDASLALNPRYSLALRVRASMRKQQGDHEAAYADYTAAILHSTTAPVKAESYVSRALCWEPADEADLDRALALDPANPDAVFWKTVALAERGQVPEAIEHISRWLTRNQSGSALWEDHQRLLHDLTEFDGER